MNTLRQLVCVSFLMILGGALFGLIADDLNPQRMLSIQANETLEEDPSRLVRDEAETGCLREALYYEGRGGLEGEQIQQGMVILARVRDPDPQWPKTICGVVKQPRQFSYNLDAELMMRPLEVPAWGRADRIARELIRDAWKEQFLPHGAECVRTYKMSDEALAKLGPKSLKQLRVSEKSLGYFAKTQKAVFTVGQHTFYQDKVGCKNPLPTT